MNASTLHAANGHVAIVPARGGSKRIPGKNVKDFLGKPVIAYAIAALRESELFAHVIVSTDNDEIAAVARHHGAEVPWRRPATLSDDAATTDAVVAHALKECTALYGPFERGCCVYPVNPLLSVELLRRGLDELESRGAASAFPVVRYDFPIEQALLLDGARPRFRWPEAVDKGSQDLAVHYHDAGMFYWFDVARFLQKPALFSDDSVAFEIDPLLCQDVNTPADWALAELKYRRLKGPPVS
ncbi:MAG: pseudaminic acid cytidylyltransferase [Sphingosinicella sp.]